jgi:polysaccharide biosynthesis/export protein
MIKFSLLILLFTASSIAEPKPSYKINIGDTLLLYIYGQPESKKEVTVDTYGNITYLHVGTVKAFGKTFPQLSQDLNKLIKKITKFSLVTASPVDFGGRYYFVSGSVNQPGRKTLRPGTSLLTAIGASGGFEVANRNSATFDQADLKQAFIIRDGQHISVNFIDLVEKGDIRQNILIKNGDFIYVPDSMDKKVYVIGEVNLQRSLELRRPLSLLQALSRSQGITEDASQNILILRGAISKPIVRVVNYKKLLDGQTKDFYLRKDDIIFVPERSTLLVEELVKLAIRTFVARIASETGSEAFRKIESKAGEGNTGLNFNFSP